MKTLVFTFFLFILSSSTFAQFKPLDWNIKDIKITSTNKIEFLIECDSLLGQFVMATTENNSKKFPTKTIYIFLDDDDKKFKANLTSTIKEIQRVRNYDAYTKKAAYKCSIEFDGLGNAKTIRGPLFYTIIHPNNKIGPGLFKFCLENSNIKSVTAGYNECNNKFVF